MITGTTIKETHHGESGCRVKLMTGLRIQLEPASNLPDSSPIKWWGTLPSHLFDDPRENEKAASIGRTIGFGFYADDVRLD